MRDASNGQGIREHVLLFSRFLRSPRTVGAVTASSRALADAMVRDLDLGHPGRIIELGPGTGAFTSAIVDGLGAGTEFLAIDIDSEFVKQIQKRFPAIDCVCASAENLEAIARDRGLWPVEHIVSGLPFVSLPQPMTKQILEGVQHSLRPGGTFTTFQYVHGYGLPSAIAFRRAMSEKLGGPPRVRLVLRNIPPALVLTWQKAEESKGAAR